MSRPVRLKQFSHLTIAHLKEISRQPAVLFWGIVFPILLAIGLGLAFTRDAETVHNIGVVADGDESPSTLSKLEAQFGKAAAKPNREFRIRGPEMIELAIADEKLGDILYLFEPGSWEASITGLKQGRISMIMTFTDNGPVYHFDPQNPAAQLAWLRLSLLAEGESGSLKGPETDAYTEGEVSPLELPGTRYIDFLVPGLVSMTIMMSCMWGISYGMIDKRSRKLLRRMVATPMVRSHFLAALMVVRIFINTVESALLVFFAWLIFDISIQGSPWALIIVFLAGNIAFCGIAVFTSSRTANTEVGNGVINAVVMPMTLLSGVFFSYHNFPEWSIVIIEKLPLTLLVDGIRGVFTEGAGLAQTAPAALGLFLIGTVFFAAGLKIFKWH